MLRGAKCSNDLASSAFCATLRQQENALRVLCPQRANSCNIEAHWWCGQSAAHADNDAVWLHPVQVGIGTVVDYTKWQRGHAVPLDTPHKWAACVSVCLCAGCCIVWSCVFHLLRFMCRPAAGPVRMRRFGADCGHMFGFVDVPILPRPMRRSLDNLQDRSGTNHTKARAVHCACALSPLRAERGSDLRTLSVSDRDSECGTLNVRGGALLALALSYLPCISARPRSLWRHASGICLRDMYCR